MLKNYRVGFGDRAAFRGKRGRYAHSYVRASSPEKAVEVARRFNFSKVIRFPLSVREATPRELGCITQEEAAAMAAELRAAWAAKHG